VIEPSNSFIRLPKLRWRDVLLLTAWCALLFGYISISGRPMTMHEARLPQTAREMMLQHQWIFPHNGDRPWLERPPVPHWIMIGFAALLGGPLDAEWSARIPPAVMGCLIVLMTAYLAARWFGRNIGMAAGLMLSTGYEFYYYATLAEDDIFLAALAVATILLFVDIDGIGQTRRERQWHSLGNRTWRDWLMFFLLGLTNLAKGPLVGAAVIIGTLGAYLLWQASTEQLWSQRYRRISRYVWLWGWLLAAVVGASWHIAAAHYFPGAGGYVDNLRFDFNDTTEYDENHFYYLYTILAVMLPWTPVALVGLIRLFGAAFDKPSPQPSPGAPGEGERAIARFLWTWAIVPVIVLSLPHRKHHHYLVPSLAPWGILAAIGVRPIIRNMFLGSRTTRRPLFGLAVFGLPGAIILAVCHNMIPGPVSIAPVLIAVWLACVFLFYLGLLHRRPSFVLAGIVLGIGLAYCWGQSYLPNDETPDTIFLRTAEKLTPLKTPLLVNGSVDTLEFFRNQFYLRPQAILIHNLSYLQSTQFAGDPVVYVVSRARDLPALQKLGQVQMLAQSSHSCREDKHGGPAWRFTLFQLQFNTGLPRYAPPPVSVKQAMLRDPGPWCGPALDGKMPPQR